MAVFLLYFPIIFASAEVRFFLLLLSLSIKRQIRGSFTAVQKTYTT